MASNDDGKGKFSLHTKPASNEGGEESKPPRDHVSLKNELVERGGKPLFERKPPRRIPPPLDVLCHRS